MHHIIIAFSTYVDLTSDPWYNLKACKYPQLIVHNKMSLS